MFDYEDILKCAMYRKNLSFPLFLPGCHHLSGVAIVVVILLCDGLTLNNM